MIAPGTKLAAFEVEMAIADVEVADIFRDATSNYLDELAQWLAPTGDSPNAALLGEVHKAQTLLMEIDSRLFDAKKRLENALKLAGVA